MSDPDAPPPEMRYLRFHTHLDPLDLDGHTASRLMDRDMVCDDAPPQYRHVARLIQALADEATTVELATEGPSVAGIAAAIASSHRPPARRSSMPRSFLSAKKKTVAATVGVLALFVGLAAAGALPGAVNPLHTDGIDVTTPNDGHADQRGKSAEHVPETTPPTQGDVSGTADTSGKGADISATAQNPDLTGVEKGAEVSKQASSGQSQAGLDHPSADVPPVPPSTPDAATDGLGHRPQQP